MILDRRARTDKCRVWKCRATRLRFDKPQPADVVFRLALRKRRAVSWAPIDPQLYCSCAQCAHCLLHTVSNITECETQLWTCDVTSLVPLEDDNIEV